MVAMWSLNETKGILKWNELNEIRCKINSIYFIKTAAEQCRNFIKVQASELKLMQPHGRVVYYLADFVRTGRGSFSDFAMLATLMTLTN